MPNNILENISQDPQRPNEVPTLDTLYRAFGGSLPRPPDNDYNATMTYYHGPSVAQGFLFTRFDLWTFQRAQCQGLIDFVLGRIWGLPRSRSAGLVVRPEGPRGDARPARPVPSRDPERMRK